LQLQLTWWTPAVSLWRRFWPTCATARSERIARRAGWVLACGTLCLVVGCSSGESENQVLANAPSGYYTYDVNVQEPIDIIIYFQNQTDQPLHLQKISVIGSIKHMRLISVSAYDQRRIGDAPATATGILPLQCPKWVPSPMSKVTIPAHSDTPWIGVVTISFDRPGTYWLNDFRVDYFTPGGGAGWDRLSDPVELTVAEPARPNPITEPSSQC
jgi:hypothetical protein